MSRARGRGLTDTSAPGFDPSPSLKPTVSFSQHQRLIIVTPGSAGTRPSANVTAQTFRAAQHLIKQPGANDPPTSPPKKALLHVNGRHMFINI